MDDPPPPNDDTLSNLQGVLARAKHAISRAKNLSDRYEAAAAAAQRLEGITVGGGSTSIQDPHSSEPAMELSMSGIVERPALRDTTREAESRLRRGAWSAAAQGSVSQTQNLAQASANQQETAVQQEESFQNRIQVIENGGFMQGRPDVHTGRISGMQQHRTSDGAGEYADGSSLQGHVSASPSTVISITATERNPQTGPATQGSDGSTNPTNALMTLASRLSTLQQQQDGTMMQLLELRREQLRLRHQQLTSLRELLEAEIVMVEGTDLQLAAFRQAVTLIENTLLQVDTASELLTNSSASNMDVNVIAHIVTQADSRAELITGMTRQLLRTLREHHDNMALRLRPPVTSETALQSQRAAATEAIPDVQAPANGSSSSASGIDVDVPSTVAGGASAPGQPQAAATTAAGLPLTGWFQCKQTRGATPFEIRNLPAGRLPVDYAVDESDPCTICLETFQPTQQVKWMLCGHRFHTQCIDEWLDVKALCPLCKSALPAAEQHYWVNLTIRAAIGHDGDLTEHGLQQILSQIPMSNVQQLNIGRNGTTQEDAPSGTDNTFEPENQQAATTSPAAEDTTSPAEESAMYVDGFQNNSPVPLPPPTTVRERVLTPATIVESARLLREAAPEQMPDFQFLTEDSEEDDGRHSVWNAVWNPEDELTFEQYLQVQEMMYGNLSEPGTDDDEENEPEMSQEERDALVSQRFHELSRLVRQGQQQATQAPSQDMLIEATAENTDELLTTLPNDTPAAGTTSTARNSTGIQQPLVDDEGSIRRGAQRRSRPRTARRPGSTSSAQPSLPARRMPEQQQQRTAEPHECLPPVRQPSPTVSTQLQQPTRPDQEAQSARQQRTLVGWIAGASGQLLANTFNAVSGAVSGAFMQGFRAGMNGRAPSRGGRATLPDEDFADDTDMR